MAKKITSAQLIRAFRTAPTEVANEGKIFLTRGLSEYKRIALQTKPWKVGQSGGGIPVATGNLREQHRTVISRLTGRFGVGQTRVKYAGYVHDGTRKMEARPWLEYARIKADGAVKKHYKVFMDNILKHIAT
jgi:hypothetical protein